MTEDQSKVSDPWHRTGGRQFPVDIPAAMAINVASHQSFRCRLDPADADCRPVIRAPRSGRERGAC